MRAFFANALLFCVLLLAASALLPSKCLAQIILPRHTISGRVYDSATGGLIITGVSGVSVTVGSQTTTTDGTGNYTITNLLDGSYTVTPSKVGLAFSPDFQTFFVGANVQNVDFSVAHNFNGVITNLTTGVGVGGVTLTAGGQTSGTAANGRYFFNSFPVGTYSVVPSSSNYIFSPASQIVKLGPDKTNVSFGATPAYSVSGKVTDASYLPYQPLAGVVVSAGGHSDISDSNGLYTIPLLTNGTYVVTGAKAQYQISPASVQVSSKNVTNLNLSGNAIFSISGRVMLGTNGLPGAVVLIYRQPFETEQATTDANGFFTYSAILYPGGNTNFVFAPLVEGYSFSPASRATSIPGNASNLDFTVQTFDVSGRVSDGANGLPGVSLNMGGRVATTDSDGRYAFTNLAGNFTVIPTQTGQTFEPGRRTFTAIAGLTNLNFQRGPTHTTTIVSTGDRLSFYQAYSAGGRISFDADTTVQLTNTLVVTSNTVLDGGIHSLVLDAGGRFRVLQVPTNTSVTLQNVTITGGYHTVTDGSLCGFARNGSGGGIFNDGGDLTLRSCRLAGNLAHGGNLSCSSACYGQANDALGGAIYNNAGRVHVENCEFKQNTSQAGNGDELCNTGTNLVALRPGYGFGGAIYNSSGTIEITGSTFDGNLAVGGTVTQDDPAGGGFGGAIFNSLGTLNFTNCTFYTNVARQGGTFNYNIPYAYSEGGAVFNAGGTVTAFSSTFSADTILQSYGDRHGETLRNQSGSMLLRECLVSGGGPGLACYGVIADAGFNLGADSSGNFTNTGSRMGLNLMLAPLADNGGPTPTIALLPGSPAIDQGDGLNCLPFDQRGSVRPTGLLCDIGSFELLQAPIISDFAPQTGHIGTRVTIHGLDFGRATSLTFNGVPATFSISNVTSITALVPNGATSGAIRIATPDGVVSSSNVFVVDAIAPVLTIDNPRNNTFVTNLASLSGAVADNPGGSGVASVQVSVLRQEDFAFWDGLSWGPAITFNAAFGGGFWHAENGPGTPDLIDGAYAVTVTARDATGNETSTTAFITVDTSATLVQIERLANGHTRIRFPGTPGRTYRLLASDDLAHWDTIASVTVSISGILEFEDTDAASHPQRFYQTAKP